MRSIKSEWDEFAVSVFAGVEVSEVQCFEMKRSFYAGALATLMICDQDIGKMEVSKGVEAFGNLRREVEAFALEMMQKGVPR